MSLLIVYGLVAIGFSFFCSVAEAVLLSVTPSYIASLREQGNRSADLLERLKANVDRPLAAILSLNTIAHTAGAAGVGAQAAIIWDSRAVAWASAVMTLLILVLSEIIPKTIGAVFWRPLAPWMARAVAWLILMLYPLVLLSEVLTRLVAGRGRQNVVTRAEMAAMADLAAAEGELAGREHSVFHNLLRLRSLTVQDVMTPRTVILAFPEEATVGEVRRQRPVLPVSRIPVYRDTIDDVTGFVLKSDILQAQANDRPNTKLVELRRELKAVPANASLTKLFDLLLHRREHMALVVDEYGGTDGLATMEDLVETLLGQEIVDEADTAPDMQRVARKKWEERARRLGLLLGEDGKSEASAEEAPVPDPAGRDPE